MSVPPFSVGRFSRVGSSAIILYAVRLCVRIESYIKFLLTPDAITDVRGLDRAADPEIRLALKGGDLPPLQSEIGEPGIQIMTDFTQKSHFYLIQAPPRSASSWRSTHCL